MLKLFRALLSLAILLPLTSAAVFPHENNIFSSEGTAPFAIKWKDRVIKVAVSDSLFAPTSGIKQGTDVRLALANSFLAWEDVIDVEFVTVDSDLASVSPSSVAGDGVSLITIAPTNENTAIFSGNGNVSAATTRVFYNKLGEITEADIVLNPTQLFSDDGTFGSYDLQSTLTHELGHLLGFEHSAVLGSTMYENYGRNGLFGVRNVYARTLSFSDIATARLLYPQTLTEFDCCRSINGEVDKRLLSKNKQIEFWVEDVNDGRVVSQGRVDEKGRFDIAASLSGSEKLFTRLVDGGEYHPSKDLGILSQSSDLLIRSLNFKKPSFTLEYIGLNGQLTDTAIFLTRGRTFEIYFGGLGLNIDQTKIKFSSPKLRVAPSTLKRHDYGPDVSVYSVMVQVGEDIEPGEYSLIADRNSESHTLVGAITIDNLINPH